MSDTQLFDTLTDVMRALAPPQRATRRKTPAVWHQVKLTDLTDVEELLDWLENAGYDERRLDLVGETFVVRWR